MRKRILSALLCLCMMMALLPTTAFAEETMELSDVISGHKDIYEYTGYPVELEIYTKAGINLVKDVDYKVVASEAHKLLTDVGFYGVELIGLGKYAGSSSYIYFNIVRPTVQYKYISSVGTLNANSSRRFAIGHEGQNDGVLMTLNSSGIDGVTEGVDREDLGHPPYLTRDTGTGILTIHELRSASGLILTEVAGKSDTYLIQYPDGSYLKRGGKLGGALDYIYEMLTTTSSTEATKWKFKYNDAGIGLYIVDASNESFMIGMSEDARDNQLHAVLLTYGGESNISKNISLFLYEKVQDTDPTVKVITSAATQIMQKNQTYMYLPCAIDPDGDDIITVKIYPTNTFMRVKIGADAYGEYGAAVSKGFRLNGATSKTIEYTVQTIDRYTVTKSLQLNTTNHYYDTKYEECRLETVYVDGDCTKGGEKRLHCFNEGKNGCAAYIVLQTYAPAMSHTYSSKAEQFSNEDGVKHYCICTKCGNGKAYGYCAFALIDGTYQCIVCGQQPQDSFPSTIHVTIEPAEGGTVAYGGESYSALLTAIANTHYRFVKWIYNGGNEYNYSPLYLNRWTENTVVAVFEEDPDDPPQKSAYNTPASVTQNGVTATVTFDRRSPQAVKNVITATVTLTGTAAAAGIHSINLNSTKAGLSGTAQNITVTAEQTSFAVPNTYSFTIPAEDVDDLTLTHSFAATFGLEPITGGAGILAAGANTSGAATVYYGEDSGGAPYAWRVIGYNGTGAAAPSGSMALIAAKNLAQSQFDSTANIYANSVLKTAIEKIAAGLTEKEKSAVAARTLTVSVYSGAAPYCDGLASIEVTNAFLWPLSTAEAMNMDNSLRIVDPAHPVWWASSYWWLRSPGNVKSNAAIVGGSGNVIYTGDIMSNTCGVRPAFNLKLSDVIITSAAVGGKSAAGMDTALTAVPAAATAEWKLTILDAERNFAIAVTAQDSANSTVTVGYSGAATGENEYISAVIKDRGGSITHYGRLKKLTEAAAASGTLIIDLSGIDMTGKTLYVFSEQYNGDKKTDYASALKAIMPALSLTEQDGALKLTAVGEIVAGDIFLWAEYDAAGRMRFCRTAAAGDARALPDAGYTVRAFWLAHDYSPKGAPACYPAD